MTSSRWEGGKGGTLWPVASLLMLCCIQTSSLVSLIRWNPQPTKGKDDCEDNVGPIAFLSGPTHCWAHSRPSVKYLEAVWETRIGNSTWTPPVPLIFFLSFGDFPTPAIRRFVWTSNMPRRSAGRTGPGFSLDTQTFPRYCSGSVQDVPYWWGKVRPLSRQI